MIEIMLDELNDLFSNARLQSIDGGDWLFHSGGAVEFIFLVKAGSVALERSLPNGTVTCLQRAADGAILAEASLYADTYHCGARALEPSTICRISKSEMKDRLSGSPFLGEAWARHLARTVQKTRFLSEIRSLRTVSDRLDAWLGENKTLPAKGQWQTLAAELAVSREALYRELARRT